MEWCKPITTDSRPGLGWKKNFLKDLFKTCLRVLRFFLWPSDSHETKKNRFNIYHRIVLNEILCFGQEVSFVLLLTIICTCVIKLCLLVSTVMHTEFFELSPIAAQQIHTSPLVMPVIRYSELRLESRNHAWSCSWGIQKWFWNAFELDFAVSQKSLVTYRKYQSVNQIMVWIGQWVSVIQITTMKEWCRTESDDSCKFR